MIEIDGKTLFPLPVLHDRKRDINGYDDLDWVMRVREELDEALAASTMKEKAGEIVDAMTVCISWLQKMGFDEAARAELYAVCNCKNIRRGYMTSWDNGKGEEKTQ